MKRVIIHADLDAFYASVEQLDDPQLRGKPVVVGGSPEGRGVVMAASYEARRFGVRSAMPMSRALRLCRQAIRVPPRFDRYSEVSQQVMGLFREVTPLVEPLSLDEAFLDATEHVAGYGGPESLARHLKAEVKNRTGLTLSVGVAANKLVAKIASDRGKPDGLVLVPAGTEAAFLAPLKTRARAENTFPHDLSDGPELRAELDRIAESVARRLDKSGFRARTIVLKLRYANFRTITRQSSRPLPIAGEHAVDAAAHALLDAAARPGDRFRLIGIHATNLVKGELDQLGLWVQTESARETGIERSIKSWLKAQP